MARAKYEQVIVTPQSNAAAGTVRGAIDVRNRDGGIVTMKITNGATGPTVQAEGRVMISHTELGTPVVGAAGADWKTIWRFGGGITANAVTEQSYEFGPGVKHIQIEFTGNTGQAVTVEAVASTVDYSA